MKYFILFIYLSTTTILNVSAQGMLPFSRIKIINDSIYFTLTPGNDKWHKLLSIDSIGADAILKYAKDNYGSNKCDYEIECYKYNIIANFGKIFSKISNKMMPVRIGLEYEFDNKAQNGVDVECTAEKYLHCQKSIEENIILSKSNNLFGEITNPLILKGLNKLKSAFGDRFSKKKKELQSNNKTNLRKDIEEIKTEMKNLIKEEENIEKVLNK